MELLLLQMGEGSIGESQASAHGGTSCPHGTEEPPVCMPQEGECLTHLDTGPILSGVTNRGAYALWGANFHTGSSDAKSQPSVTQSKASGTQTDTTKYNRGC